MEDRWFWQAAGWLYTLHATLLLLALPALQLSSLTGWPYYLLHLVCLLHAMLLWLLQRRNRGPAARLGLSYGNRAGWQLWNARTGWSRIRISGQSLVLPAMIILYYRKPGALLPGCLLLGKRELATQAHRSLRVRLRFVHFG